MKFLSDLAKTAVCAVLTMFRRVPKLTLTFESVTQTHQRSFFHRERYTCEVWKWLSKNCFLCRVHNLSQKGCQSRHWHLTL